MSKLKVNRRFSFLSLTIKIWVPGFKLKDYQGKETSNLLAPQVRRAGTSIFSSNLIRHSSLPTSSLKSIQVSKLFSLRNFKAQSTCIDCRRLHQIIVLVKYKLLKHQEKFLKQVKIFNPIIMKFKLTVFNKTSKLKLSPTLFIWDKDKDTWVSPYRHKVRSKKILSNLDNSNRMKT